MQCSPIASPTTGDISPVGKGKKVSAQNRGYTEPSGKPKKVQYKKLFRACWEICCLKI